MQLREAASDLDQVVDLHREDEIDLAGLIDPGISVVAQDPYAIGRAAAELLFARLDGYTGPSQHRMISTRLIIRGSGEIRPREVRPGDVTAGREVGCE